MLGNTFFTTEAREWIAFGVLFSGWIGQYIVGKIARERFRKNELDKKADITYVNKEIATVVKEFNSEISHLRSEQNQANEEQKTLLETIGCRVEFIYQEYIKEAINGKIRNDEQG